MSKKYHPDVCKDADASEKFSEVVKAYNVRSFLLLFKSQNSFNISTLDLLFININSYFYYHYYFIKHV